MKITLGSKTLLPILLFAAYVSVSFAQQSTPSYRLRTPPAQEYLQVIDDVASSGEFDTVESFGDFLAISAALFHLFPDPEKVSFTDLYDVYTRLELGQIDLFGPRGQWVRQMVAAWILENNIDLSQNTQLEFDDFHVTVIPRDFNGDGRNEYLLDITKGERVDRIQTICPSAEVIDYLLVEQTDSGYRFIDTGLPWKGQQAWVYSGLNGGLAELRFQDINADGLPEWILVVGGETQGGPGMGYADGGALLILGWRDGLLKYLVPTSFAGERYNSATTTDYSAQAQLCASSPIPPDVRWQFTNIDADAPLEILQAQDYVDNWYCARTETKIFDWNADTDRYEFLDARTAYAEETQQCVQRRAEEIMWTGDYIAAVPVFERALSLEAPARSENSAPYARSLNQYLRARLVLAYLMTGQEALADSLMEGLSDEEIEDSALTKFIQTLKVARATNTSPLEICVTAYNLFTSQFPQIVVGSTVEEMNIYYDAPYLPENIGCNAPAMLQAILADNPIPIRTSPADFLAHLGVGIERVLETDMDADGRSEWLVWSEIVGNELFFAPHGDVYAVSTSNIDPFRTTDLITEWRLPDDAGSVIVLVRSYANSNPTPPWYLAYSPFFGSGGGGPTPSCSQNNDDVTPVEFLLWGIQGEQLAPLFTNQQLCVADLETIAPNGEAPLELRLIEAYCSDIDCGESYQVEVVYEWDEEQETYIEAAPLEPTLIATSTLMPIPAPNPYSQYFDVLRTFEQGDFETVLALTSNVHISDGEGDLEFRLRLSYLRALALEALDRPDEALALYVAIRDEAPESIWGRLAALHFEES